MKIVNFNYCEISKEKYGVIWAKWEEIPEICAKFHKECVLSFTLTELSWH